jgi:hypothetical protein
VLVKRVCGHVPHRKLRQTFSSCQCRFAFATPMASGPIICYQRSSALTRKIRVTGRRTSSSLRCISARRPILRQSKHDSRILDSGCSSSKRVVRDDVVQGEEAPTP